MSDSKLFNMTESINGNAETDYPLKVRTLGDASPQGRPRVYFCCHRDDFNTYFKPITDEILEAQKNAAVWYRDPERPFAGNDQFFSDLSRMQLLVIPVTSRFLFTDDPARISEMSYAIQHHIPVLPLMQEKGLDRDFNRICGDLEFLDRNASAMDPTAIPYKKKLSFFLDSVLISNEMASKIRDAFEAYIFLSYRKKDRREAQKIMRLIHSNEFCRDTAIWYDEFLTPGENFNDEIETAMKKSRLFALVVTPSLLEDPNYVFSVEYPAAVKMGKDVLPIEAVDTDASRLEKMYQNIGECFSADKPEQVSARLRTLFQDIGLREKKDDPAHNFLIGLAYLSGIDVEVDHERAVSLIAGAAEAELPEACGKLASMYRIGEGVELNYDKAVEWQKKQIDLLYRNLMVQPSLTSFQTLLEEIEVALRDVKSNQKNAYDPEYLYTILRDCMEKMAPLRRNINRESQLQEFCQIESLYARAYMLLGVCSPDLNESEKWYIQSIETYKALVKESEDLSVRRQLVVAYTQMTYLYLAKYEPDRAEQIFLAGLEVARAIADETSSVEDRLNLFRLQFGLGYLYYRQLRKMAEAEKWLNKSLKDCSLLAAETNEKEAGSILGMCYITLAGVYRKTKRPDEATRCQEKLLELELANSKEDKTNSAKYNLASAYWSLGCCYLDNKKTAEARTCFEKSLELRLSLYETGVQSVRKDLSVSYLFLGKVSKEEKKIEEAKKWIEKALEIGEKIYDYNVVSDGYQLMLDISKKERDKAGKMKWSEKLQALK